MKNQEELTPTEARQATMRPRAMVWVLFGSLFLCLMAGLGLALVGLVSRSWRPSSDQPPGFLLGNCVALRESNLIFGSYQIQNRPTPSPACPRTLWPIS